MKTTKLKTSRFNTKTNWERVKEFMLRFQGDIVLNENHRIVCYHLCEKHGLVINFGQTSYFDESDCHIVLPPEAINKGTIKGNRLTAPSGGTEDHVLDFYRLVEAPIL